MKKFYILIIIALVLNLSIFILGYYFINYPMKFNLWYIIKECGIGALLIILGIITLVSWLSSVIEIKHLDPKTKFLRAFLILNGLLFVFLLYYSLDQFIQAKKEITNLENEYLKQAKIDIKNDHVSIKYAGGFELPMYDEKTIHKIDSIRKKYGVTYQNTGCIIDNIDIKAQEKYDDTVMPYLDKRNGKGWQHRMEKEIDNLKKAAKK